MTAELFPNLPPASPPAKIFCTRETYVKECGVRWGGWALQDALENWDDYEEQRETFRAWCTHYKRDPNMYVGRKAHNPHGNLTSMVWVMQEAIEPDKSCLHPCLDFEEHFQTAFVRRGLMIYLTLLLKEMEK